MPRTFTTDRCALATTADPPSRLSSPAEARSALQDAPAAGAAVPAMVNPGLARDQLLDLYYYMRLTRSLEERLSNLFRQNKVVGGFYRSLGQEATAVGSSYALGDGDVLSPLIRDMGALLVRGARPSEIFMQYMARADGGTRGRDLNIHIADLDRGYVGPISQLGDMVPVMAGIALGARMQGNKIVTMVYVGDGASQELSGAKQVGLEAVLIAPPDEIPADTTKSESSTWAGKRIASRPPHSCRRRTCNFP